MALKAILEKVDDLSDELKKQYKEKDGKFYLDVSSVAGFALEDIQGLKKSLQGERDSVSGLKKELKDYKEIGTIEDVRDGMDKVKDFDKMTPETKVKEQIDSAIGKAEKQWIKKFDKQELQRSNLLNHVQDLAVVATATTAINEKKGSVELLLPHVKNNIKLNFADDDYKSFDTVVIDRDGQTKMTNKQGSTDKMGIDEYVGEMASNKTFQRAFDGTGRTGSGGMPPQTDSSSSLSEEQLLKLEPVERMKVIRRKEQATSQD